MKMRTRNPPARTASRAVSQSEICDVKYIPIQSKAYPPMELVNCQALRQREGRWKGRTASRQLEFAGLAGLAVAQGVGISDVIKRGGPFRENDNAAVSDHRISNRPLLGSIHQHLKGT